MNKKGSKEREKKEEEKKKQRNKEEYRKIFQNCYKKKNYLSCFKKFFFSI